MEFVIVVTLSPFTFFFFPVETLPLVMSILIDFKVLSLSLLENVFYHK